MKLQDLKDELAFLDEFYEDIGLPRGDARQPRRVVDEIARRVAALFAPCPYCAAPVTGERVNRECFRCHREGVVPNMEVTSPMALYRYLFADTGEPGPWA